MGVSVSALYSHPQLSNSSRNINQDMGSFFLNENSNLDLIHTLVLAS
jgi:hypothetical protein